MSWLCSCKVLSVILCQCYQMLYAVINFVFRLDSVQWSRDVYITASIYAEFIHYHLLMPHHSLLTPCHHDLMSTPHFPSHNRLPSSLPTSCLQSCLVWLMAHQSQL